MQGHRVEATPMVSELGQDEAVDFKAFERNSSRRALAAVRRFGPNAAAGVSDQALFSGANAAINFALARWLTAGEYGIYGLGSTLFLIASGVHNSLVLEPVGVLGASRFSGQIHVYLKNVFFGQLAVSFLTSGVLVAAAAFLPIGAELKAALLGAAILCPPVLTVWYFRRVQYLLGNPKKAAALSALYALSLMVLFYVVRQHWPLSALKSLSLVAVAAAFSCVPCLRLPFQPGLFPSPEAIGGAHWRFGKWILIASVLAVGSNHIQLLLVARYLGMAGTGTFRAMMNFGLPMVQLVTALSNLALPSLARAYDQHPVRFKTAARNLILSYGAGGFVYMIALCLFGARLEALAYGEKFRIDSGMLPILGIWIFAVCVSNAAGVVLRAGQAPKACLIALLAAGAFGFATAQPLIHAFGLSGAALSMAGTYVVSAILQLAAYRRIFCSPRSLSFPITTSA